jgi:hypothetical protein
MGEKQTGGSVSSANRERITWAISLHRCYCPGGRATGHSLVLMFRLVARRNGRVLELRMLAVAQTP